VAFFSAQVFAGALDGFRLLATRAAAIPGGEAVAARMSLTDVVVVRLLGSVGLLLVVAAPFLSMRLVAEERRTGTFELLMTAPIRPVEIVAGKYLASLAVLVVALCLVALFPAFLAVAGRGAQGGGAIEWPAVQTHRLWPRWVADPDSAIGIDGDAVPGGTVDADAVEIAAADLHHSIPRSAKDT
jgi:hypothetical protein